MTTDDKTTPIIPRLEIPEFLREAHEIGQARLSIADAIACGLYHCVCFTGEIYTVENCSDYEPGETRTCIVHASDHIFTLESARASVAAWMEGTPDPCGHVEGLHWFRLERIFIAATAFLTGLLDPRQSAHEIQRDIDTLAVRRKIGSFSDACGAADLGAYQAASVKANALRKAGVEKRTLALLEGVFPSETLENRHCSYPDDHIVERRRALLASASG